MKLSTTIIGVLIVLVLTSVAFFLSNYTPYGYIVFAVFSLSFAYKKYTNLNQKIDEAAAAELSPTYGPNYDYENSGDNFLKRVKSLKAESEQQWKFILLILLSSAIIYIIFFRDTLSNLSDPVILKGMLAYVIVILGGNLLIGLLSQFFQIIIAIPVSLIFREPNLAIKIGSVINGAFIGFVFTFFAKLIFHWLTGSFLIYQFLIIAAIVLTIMNSKGIKIQVNRTFQLFQVFGGICGFIVGYKCFFQ